MSKLWQKIKCLFGKHQYETLTARDGDRVIHMKLKCKCCGSEYPKTGWVRV